METIFEKGKFEVTLVIVGKTAEGGITNTHTTQPADALFMHNAEGNQTMLMSGDESRMVQLFIPDDAILQAGEYIKKQRDILLKQNVE